MSQTIEQMDLRVNLNKNLPETDKDEKLVKDADDYDDEFEEKPSVTLTYRQVIEFIMASMVNRPDFLNDLLEQIVHGTPDIDQFIYHKLFELHLQ